MKIDGSARRTWLLLSLSGLGLGLLAWVGPGEAIHHQFHKWDLRPYFKACPCAGAESSGSAWGDKCCGGHWMCKHPGISRAGLAVVVLAAANGVAALATVLRREADMPAARGRRGGHECEAQSEADLA